MVASVVAPVVCKPKLQQVKLAKSVAVAIKVASNAKEAAERLCRTVQSDIGVSLLVGAAAAVDTMDDARGATVAVKERATSSNDGSHRVSRTIKLLRNDKVSPIIVKAQTKRFARACEVIDASA